MADADRPAPGAQLRPAGTDEARLRGAPSRPGRGAAPGRGTPRPPAGPDVGPGAALRDPARGGVAARPPGVDARGDRGRARDLRGDVAPAPVPGAPGAQGPPRARR